MDLIGQEMSTRKRFNAPEVKVVLDSQDDDTVTKLIKGVIKEAIIVDPTKRLTAEEVLKKLNEVRFHYILHQRSR